MLFTAVIAVAAVLAIEDRRDVAIAAEISRSESDLRELGAQIAAIKDGDLTSMNDYIAAYAQVEPLEKEYDQKLQKFTDLYRTAKERDSHRSVMNLQRLRGKHHPETWKNMSQIIDLVRQINEITKREISVVHAMASLPEPERPDSGTNSSCRWRLKSTHFAKNFRESARNSRLAVQFNSFLTISHDISESGRRIFGGSPADTAKRCQFNRIRRLDLNLVIVITFMRNDCTSKDERDVAAADIYASHQAGQSASGDLAKAATLRHRAAG